MAISLKDLKKVRATAPPRIILYSPPGMGKTTLASEFPAAVFIQVEEGTPSDLELTAFPKPKTFTDVLDAIGSLYADPHDYRTLVIDSLSELEKLVMAEVCTRNNWKSIEQPGYGKGYKECEYVWQEFIDGCNALRNDRGMAIVMIAHAIIDRFDDPTTQSYSRYDIALHKSAKALFDREVDAIFLIKQEVMVQKEDMGFNKQRAVGMSGSTRWIYTEGRPGFLAKSRYALPDKIMYVRGEGFAALAQALPTLAPAPQQQAAA
jgi:hypothetical protein